uniref:NADH-ubiquinone oxidoreductase chain 1 n=1 Tax=Ricinus sp. ADS-2020 TaxID=2794903 RepID=A0A7T1M8E8_9NEOP|nr:NADH dehydrogenase subunit 1 [Ricinus sp. ADS-2020]
MELLNFIFSLIQFLVFYMCVLLSVAIFSLLERKILGMIHFRKGPNVVIYKGLFQPFADAMKLLTKDDFSPVWSNKISYYLGPMLMMFLSSLCFVLLPSFWVTFYSLFSLLIIFFLLGLTVYGLILSGWASNSKFSMIGAMRAISQTVSYEVVFSFLLLSIIFFICSFSLSKIHSFSFPLFIGLFPISILILFSILAELNRTPFDLAEGESELVSGYSVEYGGVMYTFMFLGENMFLLFACMMLSLIFFGSHSLFSLSVSNVLMMFFLCLVRSICPRVRYDKLMSIGWKKFLPLSMLLSNFFFFSQCIN